MQAIVAVDQNWAIGQDGDQLCYLPPDLKRVSAAHHGPPRPPGAEDPGHLSRGRPLKNRRNLILSRNPAFAPEGGEVFSALDEALAAAPADTFVIGGESLYRQTLDRCDTVYVTKLHRSFPGADRFFPNLDQAPAWILAEVEGPYVYGDLAYTYCTYHRRKA